MRCLPPRRARRLTPRLAMALAMTMAMSGLALPALAQDSPPPAAPQPAARTPAAREELPREASQRIIGREVTGPSGEVVGRIVNVLLDDNGQPRAAVLDYGGFLGVGRRRVAVAWRTLRFSPEIVRLELTRDQMRAFPDYKEGEPVVVAAPPASEPVPARPEPAAPGAAQPLTPPGADPARSP